jgi:small nuclear ribonucleoprotein (snRNP)-like protein
MAKPAKQAKDLSLSSVSKDNEKKYKETKRVDFPNGAKLDIPVYIRPTKIQLIIAELIDVMKEGAVEGKTFDLSTVLILRTSLLIKHLTSISIDGDTKGYDGLMNLFLELKDGEYIEPIIQAFDINEIAKVDEKINQAMEFLARELKKDSELQIEDEEEEQEVDVDHA